VHELRPQFPLPVLLKVAVLPRSVFYYHLKARQVADKYAEVKNEIGSIYDEHKGRYGYRRVTAVLQLMGRKINHKTVQRLMGELNLKSLVRPKKYQSYKEEMGKAASNELDRKFEAEAPNQKWVTDVTEFKVGGEKLYLSPILDLYNGEIVTFETNRRPVFELVGSMLNKALAKLKPHERPMLHSDQGWHYRMPGYQATLKDRGMVQSMSKKGCCYDNAAMESFFGVLKTEFFYLKKFSSIDELQEGLVEYIKYYNNKRIKLKLKGLSPVQYRTQAMGA
jgi:putative transposase